VSSASKIPDCVVAHRSDRSDATAPPSSVLRSWICGSTKEPSGFPENHQKPRELVVASTNHYSWGERHASFALSKFSLTRSVSEYGSTKEPSGFPENHQKPRELVVASTNHYSWGERHASFALSKFSLTRSVSEYVLLLCNPCLVGRFCSNLVVESLDKILFKGVGCDAPGFHPG
jgi:hypothetical protein